MKRIARAFAILTFSFVGISSADAKVLDMKHDWFGLELFGSFHYLSNFSATRSTVPSTMTIDPEYLKWDLDAGLNFFFNFAGVITLRLGGVYHAPTNYTETGANAAGAPYYSADITAYSLGYQAGVDITFADLGWSRFSIGGFVGMNALNKVTAEYTFAAAGTSAGEVNHTEKYSSSNQLFYEGHAGWEMALIDRLTFLLESGYQVTVIKDWTADETYTSFGRTVAAGGSVTSTGLAAKSERLGGLFVRIALRSYF